MTYLNILNKSLEESNKENNELIAEEAQINLQSSIFNCKKNIISKENELQKLKQSRALDFKSITKAMNEIELAKREKKQLEELYAELFPSEEDSKEEVISLRKENQ